MSTDPLRLPSSTRTNSSPAILWADSSSVNPFRTRVNHATVTKVDGHEIDWQHQSIELHPGRHLVQIKHQRDSWFCGYLGCILITEGTHELELNAEEGHSYIPFAFRYCERDWIWIEDTGNFASSDLLGARETGGHVNRWYPAEATSEVVAGERPPSACPVSDSDGQSQ